MDHNNIQKEINSCQIHLIGLKIILSCEKFYIHVFLPWVTKNRGSDHQEHGTDVCASFLFGFHSFSGLSRVSRLFDSIRSALSAALTQWREGLKGRWQGPRKVR